MPSSDVGARARASATSATPEVAAALALFRERLYKAMLNPSGTPIEDVMRSWQTWEAVTLRNETDCHTAIQTFLERDHADRLNHDTEYTNYKQFIQQTKQAYDASTIGDHFKTRRVYVRSCVKPPSILRTPSTLYTMMVKK